MQYSRVCQTGHHDRHHTHHNHRRGTKAGEGFLGIEHSRDEQQTYGTKKHQIGAQLGGHQYSEHTQHRHDGNPCINAKTQKLKCFHCPFLNC